jgi:phosphate transport system substrate-binding protein
MKKIIVVALSLVLAATMFAGCSSDSLTGSVTMAGSTSMEKLAKAWGEAFTEENADVTVDVQAGGSGAGYTQCTEGNVDIGNMSRALKESEESDDITAYTVAYDGIAIIVNTENTVTDLTKEQIAGIFTGEYTNWSELGGPDMEIVVVGREAGSGTRDGFESVLDVEDECVYDSEQTETGSVKTTVEATPGAIGYISLGYLDDTVVALKVDGAEATVANVQDGTYAVQRPFTMIIMADNDNETAAEFLEFVLSDEGQQIVEDMGFVPIS